jgi:hypothetical protein
MRRLRPVINVTLDPAVLARLRAYVAATGAKVSHVSEDALRAWLDQHAPRAEPTAT